MKSPSLPQDEQARLETLRSLNILDTLPEERFDRVTRLAKRLYGVSVSLISLVDENRQWFKSKAGVTTSETPRDISFCGHAILGDDVFIIPDARGDARFADNPLVAGYPHIRFYAGIPLRAPNGHKLGTLCIIDQIPRNLAPEDLDTLRDLASVLESELAAIQLATLDELTRLSNRRGFLMLARYSLDLCSRLGIPASLTFLDMDRLKLINDTFGHADGDWALTTFAELVRSTYRESDVLARLGGDEFAVLLTNTSKETAEQALARLRRSTEGVNKEANRGFDIRFSHGIVEFDRDKHRTVEALLRDGDSRMYEVKNARRQ